MSKAMIAIGSCKLKALLYYACASKSLPVDRRLLGSLFLFMKEATKQIEL